MGVPSGLYFNNSKSSSFLGNLTGEAIAANSLLGLSKRKQEIKKRSGDPKRFDYNFHARLYKSILLKLITGTLYSGLKVEVREREHAFIQR